MKKTTSITVLVRSDAVRLDATIALVDNQLIIKGDHDAAQAALESLVKAWNGSEAGKEAKP